MPYNNIQCIRLFKGIAEMRRGAHYSHLVSCCRRLSQAPTYLCPFSHAKAHKFTYQPVKPMRLLRSPSRRTWPIAIPGTRRTTSCLTVRYVTHNLKVGGACKHSTVYHILCSSINVSACSVYNIVCSAPCCSANHRCILCLPSFCQSESVSESHQVCAHLFLRSRWSEVLVSLTSIYT